MDTFGRIQAVCVGLLALLMLGTCGFMQVHAHDMATAENASEAQVFQFYSAWLRPKGIFNIEHRKNSCCNRSDCFPVVETKMDAQGRYVVRPEIHGFPGQWFTVNPSIIESRQGDPRDSPDGRSHVCIIGGVVACFVEGGGI